MLLRGARGGRWTFSEAVKKEHRRRLPPFAQFAVAFEGRLEVGRTLSSVPRVSLRAYGATRGVLLEASV